MLQRDQASSSATKRSASGTDRRVESSDLPAVNSPRAHAWRTRTRWAPQSMSRHRSPSSSPWRSPVIAAVSTSTRRTGPRWSSGGGGAGPRRPRRVDAGAADDDVVGDRADDRRELLEREEL